MSEILFRAVYLPKSVPITLDFYAESRALAEDHARHVLAASEELVNYALSGVMRVLSDEPTKPPGQLIRLEKVTS